MPRRTAYALIVPAALATALLLGYFLAGLEIEKQVHALESSLDAEGYTTMSSVYTRGLFSSTGTSVHALDGPPAEGGGPTIHLEHSIFHGPFPLGPGGPSRVFKLRPLMAYAESTLRVEPSAGAGGAGAFNPVIAATTVDLRGRGVTLFRQKGSDSRLRGGYSLAWGGLRGRLAYPRTLDAIEFSVLAPSLVFSDESLGSIEVKGLALGGDFSNKLEGVDRLLGSSWSRTDSAVITFADGSRITLRGLTTETSTQHTGSRVHLLYTFALESLGIGESALGPATLRLGMHNLDSDALASLLTLFREEGKGDGGTGEHSAPGIEEIVLRLLRGSPRVEVSTLSIETPAGDISGSFTGKIIGERAGEIVAGGAVLPHVSARLAFSIPRVVLLEMLGVAYSTRLGEGKDTHEYIRDNLAKLIEEGLLTLKDGKIGIELALESGVLDINGRRLTLPSGGTPEGLPLSNPQDKPLDNPETGSE